MRRTSFTTEFTQWSISYTTHMRLQLDFSLETSVQYSTLLFRSEECFSALKKLRL